MRDASRAWRTLPVGVTALATTVALPTAGASVTVPTQARAGDGLVFVQSTNAGSATSTDPAGWTLARTITNGTALVIKVYSRVATDGDAGSTVTIAFSASGKITAAVPAYQGTDLVNPLGASVAAVDSATSSHVTPTAVVGTPGSWVLSLWEDKANAAASAWSTPDRTTTRSTVAGGGAAPSRRCSPTPERRSPPAPPTAGSPPRQKPRA